MRLLSWSISAPLDDVEARLLRFRNSYADAARPFQWKCTPRDLDTLLSKLHNPDHKLPKAA